MTKYFIMDNFFLLFFTMFLLLLSIKNHPIMIMVMILIYSSLICLNMSMWKSNYILSIFLFLMMTSGLLVIFLYFSSLISNEQFKFKFNIYLVLPSLMNTYMFYRLMKSNNSNLMIYKYKFHENSEIFNVNKSTFNNILNLYEFPLSNLTILSMFYLLFSLFSIIKICSSKSISMRKTN